MNVVLAGDGEVTLEVFVGRPDGIVHGDDNREYPCQDGQDFVGYDGVRVVRVPLCEGIYWSRKVSNTFKDKVTEACSSSIAYSGSTDPYLACSTQGSLKVCVSTDSST